MTTTPDTAAPAVDNTDRDNTDRVEALDRLASALIVAACEDDLFDLIDPAIAIGNLLDTDDARTAWYLLLDLCPVHGCDIQACADDDDMSCERQRVDGAPAARIDDASVSFDGRVWLVDVAPSNCESMKHHHDTWHEGHTDDDAEWIDYTRDTDVDRMHRHHHHTDRCRNNPRQATLRPVVTVAD